MPVAIVSGAVSGAGLAGQAIIRDIESGFFTKLLLTPTSPPGDHLGTDGRQRRHPHGPGRPHHRPRHDLGLDPATGVARPDRSSSVTPSSGAWRSRATPSFIALRTKNAAATAGRDLVFFPLIFLRTTFVPMEYITPTGSRSRRRSIRPRTCSRPCARCSTTAGRRGPCCSASPCARLRHAHRRPRPLGGAPRDAAQRLIGVRERPGRRAGRLEACVPRVTA